MIGRIFLEIIRNYNKRSKKQGVERCHNEGYIEFILAKVEKQKIEVKERMDLMPKQSVLMKRRLDGELAEMYWELRNRGLVKGTKDIVIKGIHAIYDETLERDYKQLKVRAAERIERYQADPLHRL